MKKVILSVCMLSGLVSCEKLDDFLGTPSNGDDSISKLTFVDEYVIPDGAMYKNTLIGGLSAIDYSNDEWFMISDDPNTPRFYKADIDFDEAGFTHVKITGVTELLNGNNLPFQEGSVDPESIRVTTGGSILWSSESNINNGVNPFININSMDGAFKSIVSLSDRYLVSTDENYGPRHNGSFEGLSISYDKKGYWASMELPLVQDGPEPTVEDTDSPVRIVYINESGAMGEEFAYELDPVVRKFDETAFTINGIVEILEYDHKRFLVLERSFSTGFADGGNNVKIYDVDASQATDVSAMETLNGVDYKKASKKLLFDFESVRDQLTDGIVDNIEGITFGPKLENGNRSLVLIADNNFSAFGPQLNQLILLEVE